MKTPSMEKPSIVSKNLVRFSGGEAGIWRVVESRPISGSALPAVARLNVVEGASAPAAEANPEDATWTLRGVTSNQRYVERAEGAALRAKQAGLGRPEASCAATIPITKSLTWWELAQDERRAIFEERSQHIAATLKYLPAIARRLHHSRDLGEPFDFITWFEFAPTHRGLFDELVGMLRRTEEWSYVVREVELRLERVSG